MILLNWCESLDSTPIRWLPEGDAFVIANPAAFTRDVLPRFFKKAKFESFTRKLYRWGFRQFSESACSSEFKDPSTYLDRNAYKAAGFHRDHPETCTKLRVKYSEKEQIFQLNKLRRNRSNLVHKRPETKEEQTETSSRRSLPSAKALPSSNCKGANLYTGLRLPPIERYYAGGAKMILQPPMKQAPRQLQFLPHEYAASVQFQPYTGANFCPMTGPVLNPIYLQGLAAFFPNSIW
jgi:hypothetical protein